MRLFVLMTCLTLVAETPLPRLPAELFTSKITEIKLLDHPQLKIKTDINCHTTVSPAKAQDKLIVLKTSNSFFIQHIYGLLKTACEMAATIIGESVGINISHTSLVMPPPRLMYSRATTAMIAQLFLPFPQLNSLDFYQSGPEICEEMRFDMFEKLEILSLHPDLPRIHAVDIFTNNPDRNSANILYDISSDRMIAIDMGESFGYTKLLPTNVPLEYSLELIDIADREFLPKHLDTLSSLQETLKQLTKLWKPASIKRLIDSILPCTTTSWSRINRFHKLEEKRKNLFDRIDRYYSDVEMLITVIDVVKYHKQTPLRYFTYSLYYK